ncbi:sigma 54-interacting transcriptional regulator [Thermosediminibacter litoriperuensis]|uniref:HTH-type transcriptional regulatory protein TyrR n=1 Tax=Thermosediminibacter litoriperuensis TaxID=291989 RepID=A0A5S5AXH0_9FIRM|nr:sigma 54-interacting transcriptional regulator [Thermosediminibacter litoriperuensis]TYP58567.1 transcriptional regulator of aroF, aroG, tyrA and aromatic amino acid transport [Thermosediminibacter litoriperuensis]
MIETVRFMVRTRDRVGMALDILKILYRYGINLKAMEVGPGYAWLKIEKNDSLSFDFLKQQLLMEEDVMEVEEIKLLPQEEREKKIKAVLDATVEGIIAIDKNGMITAFNPAAEKILKVKAKEAVGKPVSEILAPNLPMLRTVKTGESYDNVEIVLNSEKSKSHYITSGRPILDEDGNPVGAVASLQDIESVMNLVYSFTQPAMITFDEILGESDKIRKVKEIAKIAAKGNSTVLIRGESGTGKELFARSIHMASPRRDRPFVAVNCAAIPDTLLESELFGYEEGAFTGAKKGGKQGLFKYADKGTLFLDEIGELSTHLQVKLLRVLQEGKIRQVGGNEEIPVDVRIIAATNRNLEKLMRDGQFREDLYYRLNVIPIFIPPLRERKEDIPLLAMHLVKKLSQKMNKRVSNISPDAMKKLMEYDWPGNVRELSNVIERAMNLCDDEVIRTEHLILKEEEFNESADIQQSCGKGCKRLKEVVGEAEKKAILEALENSRSVREAARLLGVTHATVLNKMKNYGIKKEARWSE